MIIPELTSCYVLNIPMLYNIMYIGIMLPTHIPTLKKNNLALLHLLTVSSLAGHMYSRSGLITI